MANFSSTNWNSPWLGSWSRFRLAGIKPETRLEHPAVAVILPGGDEAGAIANQVIGFAVEPFGAMEKREVLFAYRDHLLRRGGVAEHDCRRHRNGLVHRRRRPPRPAPQRAPRPGFGSVGRSSGIFASGRPFPAWHSAFCRNSDRSGGSWLPPVRQQKLPKLHGNEFQGGRQECTSELPLPPRREHWNCRPGSNHLQSQWPWAGPREIQKLAIRDWNSRRGLHRCSNAQSLK